MKIKGIKIILVLLLTLQFTNCEDYLELRPEASIPSLGMDYSKAENIFLPVSAAYANLQAVRRPCFPLYRGF
jgi:hypothetical protein